MLRSLGLLIALALVTPSVAHAQVFKPKSSAKKSSDSKPKAAAKKTSSKKHSAAKKKKKSSKVAAAKSEDQDAESAPKDADKDYVKITDDDEVE